MNRPGSDGLKPTNPGGSIRDAIEWERRGNVEKEREGMAIVLPIGCRCGDGSRPGIVHTEDRCFPNPAFETPPPSPERCATCGGRRWGMADGMNEPGPCADCNPDGRFDYAPPPSARCATCGLTENDHDAHDTHGGHGNKTTREREERCETCGHEKTAHEGPGGIGDCGECGCRDYAVSDPAPEGLVESLRELVEGPRVRPRAVSPLASVIATNEIVVNFLRDALKMAEAGDVRGAVLVMEHADGTTSDRWSLAAGFYPQKLLGAIFQCITRFAARYEVSNE